MTTSHLGERERLIKRRREGKGETYLILFCFILVTVLMHYFCNINWKVYFAVDWKSVVNRQYLPYGRRKRRRRKREGGRMREKSSRRKEREIGEREKKMPFLKIIPVFFCFFVKTRPTFERVGRGCHNNFSNYIYICHVII